MSRLDRLSVEVQTLLLAACEEDLSQEQLTELEQALSNDNAARLLMDCMQLDADLRTIVRGQRALKKSFDLIGIAPARPLEPALPFHTVGAPVHGFFGNTMHGTISCLSQGWPLAYLVATVVLGLGLLVGAITYVSQPAQVVRQSAPLPSPTSATHYPLSTTHSTVGRITGMVDCQWADVGWVKRSAAPPGTKSPVSLGDKFALSSGLLEITYDTGAKVILQGPVTYEVESKTGGFLSVGKLTARVENKVVSSQLSVVSKSEIRNQKSETSNPQSLIPNPSLPTTHYPLFTIKTPTAIVTDLGTEFGVEVSRAGVTQVHVLQGSVDAQFISVQGGQEDHRRVDAGAAIEIRENGKEVASVTFAPQSFTRRLAHSPDTSAETAYIRSVLADKPLAYWPLNEPAGSWKFADRSGNGIHGYAMGKLAAGQPGPLAGKSRAAAFDGSSYIDASRHDEFVFQSNFTLEAWICTAGGWPQNPARIISANPGTHERRYHGWGLEAVHAILRPGDEPTAILRFSAHPTKDYEFPMPSGMTTGDRWIHVTFVCEPDYTGRLYLNGTHQGSVAADKPGAKGPVWIEIGGSDMFGEYWHGRLAHVAVYPRALCQQQIENHYRQSVTQ